MICTLLLAALLSAGCTTMRSVTLDQLKALGPDRTWVTQTDQSVVLMWEPKVVRDTLVGYVGRHKEKMPGAGVHRLRVQTPSPKRTALLLGGITAGLGGFLVLAGGNGRHPVVISATGPADDCERDPEQLICMGIAD